MGIYVSRFQFYGWLGKLSLYQRGKEFNHCIHSPNHTLAQDAVLFVPAHQRDHIDKADKEIHGPFQLSSRFITIEGEIGDWFIKIT